MTEIDELIERFGLEEDPEFIIIPFLGKDGMKRRRFLLKRRFVRVAYPDGNFVDYPLADVILATVEFPELPLSEALFMTGKGPDADKAGMKPGLPDS